MKLKFLCPSIKVYLNQTIPIWYCQWLFWGYFSIVELYCCYRNDMAPKAYSIYTLALDQKSLLALDVK